MGTPSVREAHCIPQFFLYNTFVECLQIEPVETEAFHQLEGELMGNFSLEVFLLELCDVRRIRRTTEACTGPRTHGTIRRM